MNLLGYFLGMDILQWSIIIVMVLMITLGIIALLLADKIEELYLSRKAKDERRRKAFERVMRMRGH